MLLPQEVSAPGRLGVPRCAAVTENLSGAGCTQHIFMSWDCKCLLGAGAAGISVRHSCVPFPRDPEHSHTALVGGREHRGGEDPALHTVGLSSELVHCGFALCVHLDKTPPSRSLRPQHC